MAQPTSPAVPIDAPSGPGALKGHLDRFLEAFPRQDHVRADPVRCVRNYGERADREVIGFLAASLAYGNVKSILNTVEAVASRMGPRPSEFVAAFHPQRDQKAFAGIRHRWSDERDLSVLVWIVRRLQEEGGSLEGAFARGHATSDSSAENGLEAFSAMALSFGHERFYSRIELQDRIGVRYFFPRPSGGSACKRLNLFLRWMVRADDGVDCGLWSGMRPDQLVIPLDTHIARIARYIGLTEMRTAGWKMATRITASLRRLDPSDPLRYDFALCHLGIAGDCPRRRDLVKCRRCPIQKVCLL